MLAKLGKVKKFLKTIVRSLFKVNEPFVTSKRNFHPPRAFWNGCGMCGGC